MNDYIYCDNCCEQIPYEKDEYYETPEGDEIEEIECPNCKCKLSVSWYSLHNFTCSIKEEKQDDILSHHKEELRTTSCSEGWSI